MSSLNSTATASYKNKLKNSGTARWREPAGEPGTREEIPARGRTMDRLGFIALFAAATFCLVSAGKDASTQTSDRPSMWEELKNLEVIDYIRTGAAVIGLLVAFFNGRRTWLLTVIVAGAASGLANVFFPASVLGYMVSYLLHKLLYLHS